MSFLNNVGIFLRIFLNKSKIFPIKNQDKALTPEPTNEPACQITKAKTKCKIFSFKIAWQNFEWNWKWRKEYK